MGDEIESCLDVACDAVERSDLAPEKLLAWAARIEENDRMGFFSRPMKLWKKSYPRDVWSHLVEDLIGRLARGKAHGQPLSDRRRAVVLRQAESALRNAGRADEIPALRAIAAQAGEKKRKRTARR